MKNRPYQAPCSAPTSGYRASDPEHSQVPASPGSTRGVGLREASRATSTAGVGVPAERGGRAAREGSDGELGFCSLQLPPASRGHFISRLVDRARARRLRHTQSLSLDLPQLSLAPCSGKVRDRGKSKTSSVP